MGTVEPHFETYFRDMNHEFPDKVSAKIMFDMGLASRIYAGGDIYLMPSKSEPCGLSQMNAMRYGTVPVVHATGGLRDTVPPCDEQGREGLGFTFQSYNGDDFFAAVKRAVALYKNNRNSFYALQRRDMEQDFSWDKPAEKYMELFRSL
jgi:starch synthase